MKPWFWRIAILTLAVGCVSNFALPSQELKSLPAIAGEWRLSSQTVFKPVPQELKNFRSGDYARKAWRGSYSGPRAMIVTIYQTSRGFDTLQQWHVVAGKIAFLKGGYLGVVESPGATQDELSRFVRAVDTALPPGEELLR